jgi:hypothetical protein
VPTGAFWQPSGSADGQVNDPLCCDGAEQLALPPPLVPLHIHAHGLPLPPDTGVALPLEHSPLLGAVAENAPFAGPH